VLSGVQALGSTFLLALFCRVIVKGVSVLTPLGLWTLVVLALSPRTLWVEWREAAYCAAQAIEIPILVHSHGATRQLQAGWVQDRWSTWLNVFVIQGGHWLPCLGLCLIYRVRFSTGVFLLAAHTAAALGTMKWAVLDPAAQHFPDYLERGSAWCLGMDGARCLAVATWLRLLLIGFALPLYLLFRQELLGRKQFLRNAGRQEQGILECHMDQLWCVVFLNVFTICTLVGQGHPVGDVIRQLF
jgi:hypothetical protein